MRDHGTWEAWILYMLKGVEQTAYQTISLVKAIREMMSACKAQMCQKTTFYCKELLEHLFKHPYTKIQFVEVALGVPEHGIGLPQ